MVLGRTSPRTFDRAEGQWFRGLGASGIRTGTSARTGQENCAEVCYPRSYRICGAGGTANAEAFVEDGRLNFGSLPCNENISLRIMRVENMVQLPAIQATRKSGKECFQGMSDGHTLQDFWAWAFSDLISNTERGKLAEYIVATAMGCEDVVLCEGAAAIVYRDKIEIVNL